MDPVRLFSIISWIALPTVMFGGYSLLGLLARDNTWLNPFRATYFRAGHAHAGCCWCFLWCTTLTWLRQLSPEV
jgi:hypothetical protein